MSAIVSGIKSGSVLAFHSPLSFPPEDTDQFPWLKNAYRHYRIDKSLGEGGFALAYLAVACDASGNPFSDKRFVLKFPRIDTSGRFSRREQADRVRLTGKKALDEWRLTRQRLQKSKCATHIIDLDNQWVNDEPCIVTVQEFLNEHIPLLTWMIKTVRFPENKREEVMWRGVHEPVHWRQICHAIALAVTDVHDRRVIHADLWPPNVFVNSKCTPVDLTFDSIQLIDFGESTTFFPSGEDLKQNDHPYRAPERDRPHFVPSEQIDVYSFGKLAMFLAAGGPLRLERDWVGRVRRDHIRTFLKYNNDRLVYELPEVVDVIARCTSLDPVDRPSMAEVAMELAPDVEVERKWPNHLDAMKERIECMKGNYESLFSGGENLLRHLVDQRIASIETMLSCFDSEMVRTEGSRSEMIRVLVTLFGKLQKGDCYASVTCPSVWQSHALGLDGRLMSATIHAARRGANISRLYAFVIEDLGIPWVESFMKALQKSQTVLSGHLQHLVNLLDDARKRYIAACAREEAAKVGSEFHWKQASSVFCTLAKMEDIWRLGDLMHKAEFLQIDGQDGGGLFVGIVPLATRAEFHALRIENPAALMAVKPEDQDEKEWLLIINDIRGREDNFGTTTEHDFGRRSIPTLRGVRVYRSIYNVPTERIRSMEEVFRNQCVNVSGALRSIATCADEATTMCSQL